MNITELKNICKQGKTGIIPNWIGYVDWDYSTNLLYFHNKDYILKEKELDLILENRNDLYYII